MACGLGSNEAEILALEVINSCQGRGSYDIEGIVRRLVASGAAYEISKGTNRTTISSENVSFRFNGLDELISTEVRPRQ
jgi:hypothetical protein